jgi:hypothetical protein
MKMREESRMKRKLNPYRNKQLTVKDALKYSKKRDFLETAKKSWSGFSQVQSKMKKQFPNFDPDSPSFMYKEKKKR